MSGRDPLTDPLSAALARARLADPTPHEVQKAAVRVLARVAVLEAGAVWEAGAAAGATWRPLGQTALLAGAACLLLALPMMLAAQPSGGAESVGTQTSRTQTSRTQTSRTQTSRTQTSREPAVRDVGTWQRRVTRALAGDVMARRRLAHGGLAARRSLLGAAEVAVRARAPERAEAALALLRTAGALRGEDDVARVAALARTPRLRPLAIDLLARSLGPYGTQQLEALLVQAPEAEREVVAALLTLAARGLREPGLQSLLAGVRLGRTEAAAAALAVAGAVDLGRFLQALPRTLRAHPHVVAAVQAAPVTTRARLLRLAARGSGAALAVASAARVVGVVERLAVEALQEDRARARYAVALLETHGGMSAQLALARALEGAAASEARRALRSHAEPGFEQALLQHAQLSPRDGLAVVVALAERGAAGHQALTRLTAEPRLARRALRVLERSQAPGAADILAGLVERPGLGGRALAALGRRLQRGDHAARRALLALAAHGHTRAVLRVLRASGSEGRRVLKGEALRALARGRAPPRVANGPPARSI